MNTKRIKTIDIVTDHVQSRFKDFVNNNLENGWILIQTLITPDGDPNCPDLLYVAIMGLEFED